MVNKGLVITALTAVLAMGTVTSAFGAGPATAPNAPHHLRRPLAASITLTPADGLAGSLFLVSGSGFGPLEVLLGQFGNAPSLTLGITDLSGNLTGAMIVPLGTAPGTYTVKVWSLLGGLARHANGSSSSGSAPYTVHPDSYNPNLTTSATYYCYGDYASVTGSGYRADASLYVYDYDYATDQWSYEGTVNSNGSGDISFYYRLAADYNNSTWHYLQVEDSASPYEYATTYYYEYSHVACFGNAVKLPHRPPPPKAGPVVNDLGNIFPH
jgi:hypothetical protein